MARHKQRHDKKNMTCGPCERGRCYECVDVSLIALGRKGICECTKKSHDGEPNRLQILDPVTGTVHAPGVEVDSEGKLYRTEPVSLDDLGDTRTVGLWRYLE